MTSHPAIRNLLAQAGLKTSLNRIKVLNTLDECAQSSGISMLELYGHLSRQGEPIPLPSVRQVVYRLKQAGLLDKDERGNYQIRDGANKDFPGDA